MINLANTFNVVVELHKLSDGETKIASFNVGEIFRCNAVYSNKNLEEKRQKGSVSCSELTFTSKSGSS